MTKAFVFGKFYPFHKGHEAMIKFALTKCEFLSVLICCSDKEKISGELREKWITETFSGTSNLEVRIFNYKEELLPNTSVTSEEASQAWAKLFKEIYADYSVVITSEPYGKLVARYMQIAALDFDIDKNIFPVSASLIRKDLFHYWNFLPVSVKQDAALKVVILGTESTGKTTLTQKLSAHYQCSKVLETARAIITDSNLFSVEDLQHAAQQHALAIRTACAGESPLVVIDTDVYITASYGLYTFDQKIELDQSIYDTNQADLYLYLCNDVSYVQDGSRLKEEERNALDLSHRKTLAWHGIKYIEISGDWKTRFEQAVSTIDELLQSDLLSRLYLK